MRADTYSNQPDRAATEAAAVARGEDSFGTSEERNEALMQIASLVPGFDCPDEDAPCLRWPHHPYVVGGPDGLQLKPSYFPFTIVPVQVYIERLVNGHRPPGTRIEWACGDKRCCRVSHMRRTLR